MSRQIPRTYALTAVAHQRRSLFQRTASADLMIQTILRYRARSRYLLHGFVVMPDHIHVLLTPPDSIERVVQLLKGGFSFAVRDLVKGDIWQQGHHEHRIRDAEDYRAQRTYIANNPTRRNLTDYPHVHIHFAEHLDPLPLHLR
jgi:putative transposase